MTNIKLYEMLSNLDEGLSKGIYERDAIALHIDNLIGVALENPNQIIINEKFNEVCIKNIKIKTKNDENDVIFLFVKKENLTNVFIHLCMDFIDMNNRKNINENPFSWFNEWKQLIGNSVKNKMVYDVIAEMQTLVCLQKMKQNPKWASINKNTFDILTNEAFFEVKSTISKTKNAITINNQFQANDKNVSNELFLIFCRLEQNDLGICIDELFHELIKFGYNKEELNNYLDLIGYGIGKQERYLKYLIHEIRKYKVDDNFPSISLNIFEDEKIKNHLLKIEYTISLDGLDYQDLTGENYVKII